MAGCGPDVTGLWKVHWIENHSGTQEPASQRLSLSGTWTESLLSLPEGWRSEWLWLVGDVRFPLQQGALSCDTWKHRHNFGFCFF